MRKTTVSANQRQVDPNIIQKYITCRQGAEILKISEISVRRYLTQKKLRRFKVGSRTLILLSEVQSLIREAE
ncbi:MAG TPA: helix-turn-helix domain-containing protein [Candidatus Acidoferrales bacterium]|nr:helix-turn-helix domain-containing protein [Candidatus Acidoferrales bacterium]